MRVRGLKLLCELAKATGRRVAPHVGAWIETSKLGGVRQPLQVAPHAGALVEVQTAIQCWEVCIGVALAVGYETTADGVQFHPPLLWYARHELILMGASP